MLPAKKVLKSSGEIFIKLSLPVVILMTSYAVYDLLAMKGDMIDFLMDKSTKKHYIKKRCKEKIENEINGIDNFEEKVILIDKFSELVDECIITAKK